MRNIYECLKGEYQASPRAVSSTWGGGSVMAALGPVSTGGRAQPGEFVLSLHQARILEAGLKT